MRTRTSASAQSPVCATWRAAEPCTKSSARTNSTMCRSAAVGQHREIRLAALLGLGCYVSRTSGCVAWATASTWAAALDSPDESVREAAACVVLAHCGPAVAAYASGRELPSGNPERREQEIARFEGAIRQARSILAVEDQIADIIGHYWREPDGFLKDIGSEARQIRNVDEDLWRRGGMDAMRRAHGDVVRHCPFPGVGRNLEILWHGIGRWQGSVGGIGLCERGRPHLRFSV